MRTTRAVISLVAGLVALVSCSGSTEPDTGPIDGVPAATGLASNAAAVRDRMEEIDAAVAAWRSASSLDAAGAAAETAANLVVGPNGPGYGDRNGDGIVGGNTSVGLLPGLDGTPEGLAFALAENECVERDVLGGTWDDPAAAWGEMTDAIDRWRRDNNTMPSLASHPMRIVGWATFTLKSESLDEAHEYGGHAKLHVDVAVRALDC